MNRVFGIGLLTLAGFLAACKKKSETTAPRHEETARTDNKEFSPAELIKFVFEEWYGVKDVGRIVNSKIDRQTSSEHSWGVGIHADYFVDIEFTQETTLLP